MIDLIYIKLIFTDIVITGVQVLICVTDDSNCFEYVKFLASVFFPLKKKGKTKQNWETFPSCKEAAVLMDHKLNNEVRLFYQLRQMASFTEL